MNKKNIFCFGFGQVAKSFIDKIKSENLEINLSITSTSDTGKRTVGNLNYHNFFFKDESYDSSLVKKLKEADCILISIPPKKGEDLVIKNFSKYIKDSSAKWITYLSTTSVYGDHKGEWVNEQSITKPTSQKGSSRLIAEKLWLSLEKKKLPIQIFRLSGIYSNKNNTLIRLRDGQSRLVNKKNHFFSRIHVEDIANVLFKSLSNFKSGEIYNISDDKPASSAEVTSFGAKLLNLDNLKMIEVENIENEILKDFYKDSKKVSNNKMKNFFNYNLKFPTYVEGLKYIRDNFM